MIARLLVALLLLGLAGCGDEEPRRSAPAPAQSAVEASIELDMPAAAPPDAGTQTGHRAGAARGTTRAATFSFDGIVFPAQSEVSVEGAAAEVRMLGDHGDFTVKLSGLRRGDNPLTLRATADGHQP